MLISFVLSEAVKAEYEWEGGRGGSLKRDNTGDRLFKYLIITQDVPSRQTKSSPTNHLSFT